ncbi:SLAP domain-containing protein [Sutcliffiella horikoshii]|uniref:SLAP domain-containing protein n=1 Tax=Sutcliffiella horikoshii TaxID=79883 RepID=A0A5D4SQM5_9BACI|nr:SLAP domain-containing protein [Sutcliffiella horikoshii]TYS65627.1 SLAP domain-containing protein [Sutcliffiella horikoshii]
MKRRLVPCALLIIGSVLVACSGNEEVTKGKLGNPAAASSEVEEKKPPEIDKATATAAVEEILPLYFKLLEKGDSAGYWELFEKPADEESTETVQKMMDSKITTIINESEVIYQKDNEVLATFDLKQVAEEYHPIHNFNRLGTGFIVLEKVEEVWKINQLDYITLYHYNHDDEPETIMDVDHLFFWSKELAKLKREKLLPSEWSASLLAEIKLMEDSIPDQPLQYTEAILEHFSSEELVPLQKVLNQLGDAPKDIVTINNFLLYEEHLESGYIVFNAFIRNGFEYPISNIQGTVSIFSPAVNENDETVDLQIASQVMDLTEVGVIEPGSTGLATLYFGPDSLLVEHIEDFIEYGELEIRAEMTHTHE